MTRDEFQEIVHEVAGFEYVAPDRSKEKGTKERKGGYIGVRETLELKWRTGGAWGGNCWGDEPGSYMVDSEPEPEFEELDNILMRVSPNLSFLQYKKITHSISYDSERYDEYYGNYTLYSIKRIKIDDLWNTLKDMNLV